VSDAEPLPRAARIDERGGAIGEVERQLSAECPASFAGVAFATDGILDVYSKGDDRLAGIVTDLAPVTDRCFRLRVRSGARNSLLEDVHRQVRARWAGSGPAASSPAAWTSPRIGYGSGSAS
jgi:hypothetical protein